MVKKPQRKLDDAQLAKYIDQLLDEGVSWADDTLSAERAEALRYYFGELPARLHKGSSSYVSQDVLDTIEGMRAELLETFTGAEMPVSFVSIPGVDVPHNQVATAVSRAVQAKAAKRYVQQVLFRDNPGFDLHDQWFFDALVGRTAAARVFVETATDDTEVSFEGKTEDEIGLLAMDEDIEELDAVYDETDGTYAGTFSKPARRRIRIEAIRPEDLIKHPDAKDLYDGPVAHRVTKRLSAWLEDGYDEDVLLETMSKDEREQFEEEQDARSEGFESSWEEDNGEDEVDPEITLYEVFAHIPSESGRGVRLHRIVKGGKVIFEREPVAFVPLVAFSPLRISHRFHGGSVVKSIIPTQNAKTVLYRGVLDHTTRTTNPRHMALRGALANPAELMENKLGGVVWVKRLDAIAPLDQPSLNPFVFAAIERLDAEKDDYAGLSRLSQGIDKDAISKQNSRGMIQDLADMSAKRLRIMARRFAENFLRPLAELIYKTAVLYIDTKSIVEVAGEVVEINPSDWVEDRVAYAELSLSPDAREKEAGKLIDSYSLITQDEKLEGFFTADKRREVAIRALELRGITDAESWLSEQPTQQQPGPMQQVEIQLKQQQMQIQERQQRVAEMRAQTERMKVLGTLQGDERAFFLAQMQAEAEVQLELRKMQQKEIQDEREYGLALQATEVTTIASLND